MSDVDLFLKAVKQFVPHNWVGNIESSPGTPHFDSITHMDGGLNLANQKAWAKAVFVQGGATHRLISAQPITDFGTEKAADVELDGVTQKDGGFVLSTREGLFGVRLIATWKFKNAAGKDVRYRFDGDVV